VVWGEGEKTKVGGYIPRGDMDSYLNAWAGGRVFQGVHRQAAFDVGEWGQNVAVTMRADDGTAKLHGLGQVTDSLCDDRYTLRFRKRHRCLKRDHLATQAASGKTRTKGWSLDARIGMLIAGG
jgi:hypothetical protein